ncbi:peptidoglycan-binding protein [Pedobacter frigidisoli]|uniref:peptidoglycan-binding protein n=1 Tax=Pedobacter frigidisoli TaxID=2530455 RepID=UPI00292EB7FF|nr:peptidoglycan-binding protein [Pedobacter frigidisoli]
MATVKFLLCLLCTAFIIGSGLPGGGILKPPFRNQPTRQLILQVAESQLGVHEATGSNDGLAVEKFLYYTGNAKGDPWCGAFVSWVYGQAGCGQPRTAWSPSLLPLSKRIRKPEPADVFGIYFPGLKRIAHCGIVKMQRGSWIITVEGNTNVAGSREGDGVYSKYRHIRTIKYFANWLKGNKS